MENRGKKKDCKNSDSKYQRVAILESLGIKPKEMTQIFKQHKQSTYINRMKAYEKGYVQTVQSNMKESATSLLEERKILAERCLKGANKKALHISEKSGVDMKLKEADFLLKALGETEHSGRKVDAPVLKINLKENATLNIQQNMSEIGDILSRSGLDLGELVGTEARGE